MNDFVRKWKVEIKWFGNQLQPISKWVTLLSVMTYKCALHNAIYYFKVSANTLKELANHRLL